MMHDDRDSCPEGLYVSFRYDYNLQRADMFGDHVGGVTLYVVDDQTGRVVSTRTEANTPSARPLAAPGYAMHFADLPAGRYRFVALAYQDDPARLAASQRAKFTATPLLPGDPIENLRVQLDRTPAPDGTYTIPHASLPHDTLWHGLLSEPVQVIPGTPAYATVSLVRDTKKINVTLRELDDPTTIDAADYAWTITDRNSTLAWDNTPDGTDPVVYTPHALWTTSDRARDTDPATGRIAHADFMTSRIIHHADPADDAILSITHRDTGNECVRVNLPDLLSRLRTSEETVSYTPQQFLDRAYDYHLDFYLKGGQLRYAVIHISVLSWSLRISYEQLK